MHNRDGEQSFERNILGEVDIVIKDVFHLTTGALISFYVT